MCRKKLCVLCSHWEFDGGSAGYSEWTPGEDWGMYCDKEHFSEFDPHHIQEGEYRRIMLQAETCPDFQYYEDDTEKS